MGSEYDLMVQKKTCHRCGHQIDAGSRICPYCNQEQLVRTLEGEEREVTESSPAATSPIASRAPKSSVRQVLLLIGGVALLIGMFFVGWIVYAMGQPDDEKGAMKEEAEAPAPSERPAPDITLVADGSFKGPEIEKAYTSRLDESLNEDLPEEFQRRDATALPIAVYRRVAEEEKRREEARRAELVDPREVTDAARPRRRSAEPSTPPQQDSPPSPAPLGEIPGTAPPVNETASAPASPSEKEQPTEAQPAVERTRPRPLSQPLPQILSRRAGSVLVNLTVGSDGEVANVQVIQGMPGVTDQVVRAVQRWKFQPATVNGKPVESSYQVEIVVKPR